ncbi:hypothetical protein Ccel01_14530 [Cellulosimicrobium cellulans]|uniref:Uncharacterized protein n=1 Tax=Cellulosimicrobium cellulans TaxID=1710 RepID=A0AAV5P4I4_CELCE|nr:hypothetical protein Ccel01_14530 [Cellulosimicrobium cellulans]
MRPKYSGAWSQRDAKIMYPTVVTRALGEGTFGLVVNAGVEGTGVGSPGVGDGGRRRPSGTRGTGHRSSPGRQGTNAA